MQINNIGLKCTSIVVLQSKSVTLLFIAIVCIAASSLSHDTHNALVNDSNIELGEELRKYPRRDE